ncbi:MAG: RNA polymerase sigma factor WhiG [Acidobacteria bacterium]|nr:RNA polymerase sigma factor WhiG [Acidobacteriota bacterium]
MPQQQTVTADQQHRIEAGVPFVEALARRVAASMPHSIDIGDLVQDGMIGLIDAAQRFDAGRGIKFETFAERRVRGAMIDALRRDAWPRGIRRVRRELEAARESLRRELGCEPSLADLAKRVGSDETRLGRTIVRINTIESTSPLATSDSINEASLPPVMVPSEPPSPDKALEQCEIKGRVRDAIASLPPRERKVIGLYYFGEVTMKLIGAEIGVNESRVSQLHARAIQRLRKALAQQFESDAAAANALGAVLVTMPTRATRASRTSSVAKVKTPRGVVLPYQKRSRPKSTRPATRPSVAAEVPRAAAR